MPSTLSPPQHALPEAPPLHGRDIICFSHDWTGDPLSRTHLMRLLARDNRILWVNSIGSRAPKLSKADARRAFRKLTAAAQPMREVEQNIFVINPLMIPAYGSKLIGRLNRRLLAWQVARAARRLNFSRPINWTSNPAAAVVAGAFNEEQLIYHCVDENSAFSGVSADAIASLENQLLRKADLVVVTAERLYQSKSKISHRTILIRHGVDHEHFRRALDPDLAVPSDVASLRRPILGFFGLIADWVDTELLAKVASRFPQASLVLLGKATTDVGSLQALSNVRLLGRKPYEELPAYCKAFDVGLMPFRINELTLNANPLKVREYLAAGLEVVSTAIPEVAVLDHCHVAVDSNQFLASLDRVLKHPAPRRTVSDSVRGESWEARLNEIRDHLRRTA
ncbi:MAG: glycosyltransferase [Pirellulales bacterium]